MKYQDWVATVLDEAAKLTREVGDRNSDQVYTGTVMGRLGIPSEFWDASGKPTLGFQAVLEAKADLARLQLAEQESDHYFVLSREAMMEGSEFLLRIAKDAASLRLSTDEEDFLKTACTLAEESTIAFSISRWVDGNEIFAHLHWDEDARKKIALTRTLAELGLVEARMYGGGAAHVRPVYLGFVRAEGSVTHRIAGVFMSYSHEDKITARWLGAELKLLGYRVWTDEGDIRVGESLLEKISAAIEEMDFLLALITPISVDSEWCKNELQQAMTHQLKERRVKVLPVIQGDVEPPGYLMPQKWLDIRIDKLDWVIEKLRRDIDSYMTERQGVA